ncbi:repeat-containing 41 [Octopus vulgaris]|nr:WD repeat-containing protein 41 [Octopus sinensis]XP_036368493.1 WD repeat-containing protein 41 [Octopus sinensis]XP_036368494.1 WD repeat-containing protein 41 [Octopus sinensis]CAI9739456.1 repeat-containing 41 [Octopus vulgaris]
MRNADDSPEQEKPDTLDHGQPYNLYTEIHLLEDHKDIVRKLLRLDNRRFASAADDATIIIWDVEFVQKLCTLQGHTLPITCLLPLKLDNGHQVQNLLLTGSADRQIRVWDIDTGSCLHIATDHSGSVRCLIPLNDGEMFASGGQEICVWNKEGKLLHKYNRSVNLVPVIALLSITNNRIVAASEKQLEVYSVTYEGTSSAEISFERNLGPHREPIQSLVTISDKMFCSGSIDGMIIVWSAKLKPTHSINSIPDYKGNSKLFPYSVQHVFCAENRYIFAAIGAGFCIYDVETRRFVVKKTVAHYSKILHMDLVCNGLYLATCSEDGSLRLWGRKPEVRSPMTELRSPIIHKNFSPMERFFGESILQIGSSESTKSPELLGECLGHSGAVQMFVDFGADGLITCGGDGVMIAWKNHEHEEMKRCIRVLELKLDANCTL